MTRYALDGSTRLIDGGAIVIGGSPLKLLRLTPAGAAAMRALAATGEAGPGAHRLVSRLLDSGAIHPQPDPSALDAPGAADVTVVIPAYRTPTERLSVLVAAVGREGVERVLVVDDASPEPIDVPQSAECLRLSDNVGPGGARNRGALVSATPIIVFLDADTLPEPGWLLPLLAHFADARVGLVAPRIVAQGGAGGALARFERWRSPLDLGSEPARIRSGSRVSYVPAAAIAVRASAFTALGGFDASLRFGEDVDLVWRLDEAGWGCRYEPGARVAHETRRDLTGWLRQRYEYGTSAAPLAERHPGALAPVRVSGWSAAAWMLGAAVSAPAGLALGLGSSLALARKLRPMGHPVREALRLAGLGNLFAGRILASALTRAWWPLALVAALVSRRARRVLALAAIVPAALELRADPPPLDPLRAFGLRVLDDAAYGAGVWAGAIRRRDAAALLPDFGNWPGKASVQT